MSEGLQPRVRPRWPCQPPGGLRPAFLSGPRFPYLCRRTMTGAGGPSEVKWDRLCEMPAVSSSAPGWLPSGHLTHGPVGIQTQSAAPVLPRPARGTERALCLPHHSRVWLLARGSISGPRGLGGAPAPAILPLTTGQGRGNKPQGRDRPGVSCSPPGLWPGGAFP